MDGENETEQSDNQLTFNYVVCSQTKYFKVFSTKYWFLANLPNAFYLVKREEKNLKETHNVYFLLFLPRKYLQKYNVPVQYQRQSR